MVNPRILTARHCVGVVVGNDGRRSLYLQRDGTSTPKASALGIRHTWAEAEAACRRLGIPPQAPHIQPLPPVPNLPAGVKRRAPDEVGIYHPVAMRPEHRDWLRKNPVRAAELLAWLDERAGVDTSPEPEPDLW